MSRPLKPKPPKPGFLTYDQAMALACKGKYVRCDEYMSPGWKVGRVAIRGETVKYAPGLYNINPHTGSEYQFTPQVIDTKSVLWRVVE